MLRKFAAALIATALVAGPAFAAQPLSNAGTSTPATAATVTHSKVATKPAKMVKHVRKHPRKHLTRGKVHSMKVAGHVKAKTIHRGHTAHVAKSNKGSKRA